MDFYLNYVTAWISVLLMIILLLKVVSRKLVMMYGKKSKFFMLLNSKLRFTHIYLGILLIITGFIHGFNSSLPIISFNYGTICFVLSILLMVNYYIRKKTNKIIPWIKLHRILSVLIVLSLLIHINEVGGIQILNIINSKNNTHTDTNNSDNKDDIIKEYNNNFGTNVVLKNGTFTGSAMGYRANIEVSIEVEDNMIKTITVVSISDDYKYYKNVVDTIPDSIIKQQSLAVDSISRSTYSSYGVINAVNNALKKALLSGTLPNLRTVSTNSRK